MKMTHHLYVLFVGLHLSSNAFHVFAQGEAIRDEIVTKVDPSVVAIQHENSVGSGFVLTSDGYILTNGHVVRGDDPEDPTRPAQQIMVILNDERKFPARVIGFSMDPDVAVIKIEPAEPLQPVEFADSRAARTGQSCFAVGTPAGFKRTFTSGVLSNVERTDIRTETAVFQTDAAINPGNSGGPLFDQHGRVLGINTYASIGRNNLGFTIPSHVVLDVKDSIMAHGRLRRAMLPFIAISELYDELAKGLKAAEGVLIEHVEQGSPAFLAGLRPGHIITRIDGETVTARSRAQLLDIAWALTTRTPGDKITLSVLTGGEPPSREITLTLEELEPLPRFNHHAGELVEFRVDAIGLGVRRLVLLQRIIANAGDEQGVIVSETSRNSAASLAGIRTRDIITHLAGIPTSDLPTFERVLEEQLSQHPELIEVALARGRTSFHTAIRPDYDLKGLAVGAFFDKSRPEFADLMRIELIASGCSWNALEDIEDPDIVLLAAQPGSVPDATTHGEKIRTAFDQKRIVAASGPAVIHLLSSGADLKNRKITLSKESTGLIPAGATLYTGADVETDSLLVTSTGRDRKVVRDFIRSIRKAAADLD